MLHSAFRLRIDPPYLGESMSSFIGRAAQFYAMPASLLLRQLMQGSKWEAGVRTDIDLNPPTVLEQRLAESVQGWRSPLAQHGGFWGLTLAPSCRKAYCPECFAEDLAEDRIPYFRTDWIPIFVTACWKHGTPLFDWETTDRSGMRRLPKDWLYRLSDARTGSPAFFLEHREKLVWLKEQSESCAGVEISVCTALGLLRRLQAAVEKKSDVSMPACRRLDALADVRHLTRELVAHAARYLVGRSEPPLAVTARDQRHGAWFTGMPAGTSRRHWKFSEYGLRQTPSLGWRRTYLLFAARTLAGSECFGHLLELDGATSPGWSLWWQQDLLPQLGPQQRETLSWLINQWGNWLNGNMQLKIATT